MRHAERIAKHLQMWDEWPNISPVAPDGGVASSKLITALVAVWALEDRQMQGDTWPGLLDVHASYTMLSRDDGDVYSAVLPDIAPDYSLGVEPLWRLLDAPRRVVGRGLARNALRAMRDAFELSVSMAERFGWRVAREGGGSPIAAYVETAAGLLRRRGDDARLAATARRYADEEARAFSATLERQRTITSEIGTQLAHCGWDRNDDALIEIGRALATGSPVISRIGRPAGKAWGEQRASANAAEKCAEIARQFGEDGDETGEAIASWLQHHFENRAEPPPWHYGKRKRPRHHRTSRAAREHLLWTEA